MLIGVAGMVGTGKTTLTSALAARFGLQMALESVDAENPWLESFYGGESEMRTYALHLQLHFLATRFASMRRMRGLGGSWILDRTWYEDAEIFARGLFEQGLLTSDEWMLYRRLYAELLYSPAARPPRLLVYLHAPLPAILQRIATARTPEERDVAVDYWSVLHARYESGRAISALSRAALDVRDSRLAYDPSAIEDIAARVRVELEESCRRRALAGRSPESAHWRSGRRFALQCAIPARDAEREPQL
jgi:deoxyadenosine/deoxycytidine kinase